MISQRACKAHERQELVQGAHDKQSLFSLLARCCSISTVGAELSGRARVGTAATLIHSLGT